MKDLLYSQYLVAWSNDRFPLSFIFFAPSPSPPPKKKPSQSGKTMKLEPSQWGKDTVPSLLEQKPSMLPALGACSCAFVRITKYKK